jgi:hypothetical protein
MGQIGLLHTSPAVIRFKCWGFTRPQCVSTMQSLYISFASKTITEPPLKVDANATPSKCVDPPQPTTATDGTAAYSLN